MCWSQRKALCAAEAIPFFYPLNSMTENVSIGLLMSEYNLIAAGLLNSTYSHSKLKRLEITLVIPFVVLFCKDPYRNHEINTFNKFVTIITTSWPRRFLFYSWMKHLSGYKLFLRFESFQSWRVQAVSLLAVFFGAKCIVSKRAKAKCNTFNCVGAKKLLRWNYLQG